MVEYNDPFWQMEQERRKRQQWLQEQMDQSNRGW